MRRCKNCGAVLHGAQMRIGMCECCQVAGRRCTICGGKLDRPERTAETVCYGCRCDSYLPRDYERRENYITDEVTRLAVATEHPSTGVALLDAPAGQRVANVAHKLREADIKHASALEARAGL